MARPFSEPAAAPFPIGCSTSHLNSPKFKTTPSEQEFSIKSSNSFSLTSISALSEGSSFSKKITRALLKNCIKSHPNSQNMSAAGMEPPISNALMAALKRAQAHQRRGCPEQQQQPLLAVKVEIEQLIISILDDPSVSRVMREASFSSPAVKAMVEQSLNFSSYSSSSCVTSNPIGLGIRPKTVAPPAITSRNLYMNPRLQSGQQKVDEVKRITDILLRTKKRNPILVGESEPESVIKELLRRIENMEIQEMVFNNARVIFLEKELPSDKIEIPVRLKELGDLI